MAKKYKYILGIDPSGSFKEGKGTTGWCVVHAQTNTVVQTGTLKASDYNNNHAYWDAHIALIKRARDVYKNSMALSIEDYILYKNHAMSQVNSQMETVQLLGIIKHYCYKHNIKYYIRPAVAVKNRWTDDILVYKNILIKLGKKYFIPNSNHAICEHERDSIRHAIHCSVFENGKD